METFRFLYEEFSQFHPELGLDRFIKWQCCNTYTFPFLQAGLNSAGFGAMPNVKKTKFGGIFCFLTQHWETYIKLKKKNRHYTRAFNLIPHLKSSSSSFE